MQALLQAHDVVAHEVYTEDAVHLIPALHPSPAVVPPFFNGEAGEQTIAEPGLPPMDGDGSYLRVRLVQFQKNTDEPMVSPSQKTAHVTGRFSGPRPRAAYVT